MTPRTSTWRSSTSRGSTTSSPNGSLACATCSTTRRTLAPDRRAGTATTRCWAASWSCSSCSSTAPCCARRWLAPAATALRATQRLQLPRYAGMPDKVCFEAPERAPAPAPITVRTPTQSRPPPPPPPPPQSTSPTRRSFHTWRSTAASVSCVFRRCRTRRLPAVATSSAGAVCLSGAGRRRRRQRSARSAGRRCGPASCSLSAENRRRVGASAHRRIDASARSAQGVPAGPGCSRGYRQVQPGEKGAERRSGEKHARRI